MMSSRPSKSGGSRPSKSARTSSKTSASAGKAAQTTPVKPDMADDADTSTDTEKTSVKAPVRARVGARDANAKPASAESAGVGKKAGMAATSGTGTSAAQRVQRKRVQENPRYTPAGFREWVASWRPELVALVVLSMLTRLVNVTTPHTVVFDEVYFKTDVGDYLTHQFYFDPHPPLTKELLALFAWITGQNGAGMAGTAPAVTVRYLPAFAGALLVPVVWAILRQLGASRRVAFLGGAAVLLDNALIVESRFILTDSMLLLFGMTAVALYLASRHREGRKHWAYVFGAALMAGAAFTTKWTGLTAGGLIGLIWFYDLLMTVRYSRGPGLWRRPTGIAVIFVVLPIFIYLAAFWVHFELLYKTGTGNGWMPADFAKTLQGSPTYDPSFHMSFLRKVIDSYNGSKAYEAAVTKIGHPYGSTWNQWPLENRDLYYWAGATVNGEQGNIYLLGNPAVWWGAVAGMVIVVIGLASQYRRFTGYYFALAVLGAGYLANWLPFERIQRVMFLYHYLFALMFSICIAVLGIGILVGWNAEDDRVFWARWDAKKDILYVAILVAMLGCFVYFAPLTYGTPMSPSELMNHMWLSKWR